MDENIDEILEVKKNLQGERPQIQINLPKIAFILSIVVAGTQIILFIWDYYFQPLVEITVGLFELIFHLMVIVAVASLLMAITSFFFKRYASKYFLAISAIVILIIATAVFYGLTFMFLLSRAFH
jgi:hypothetical protein